jgi:hypothetical protein
VNTTFESWDVKGVLYPNSKGIFKMINESRYEDFFRRYTIVYVFLLLLAIIIEEAIKTKNKLL